MLALDKIQETNLNSTDLNKHYFDLVKNRQIDELRRELTNRTKDEIIKIVNQRDDRGWTLISYLQFSICNDLGDGPAIPVIEGVRLLIPYCNRKVLFNHLRSDALSSAVFHRHTQGEYILDDPIAAGLVETNLGIPRDQIRLACTGAKPNANHLIACLIGLAMFAAGALTQHLFLLCFGVATCAVSLYSASNRFFAGKAIQSSLEENHNKPSMAS